MTEGTDAPSGGPAVDTPKKPARRGGRRGMLAFYVGTGVVVALLVAGYLAWTPLRVWHLGRKIRYMTPGSIEDARIPEVRKLADMGPCSRAAIAELLRDRRPYLRGAVLQALGKRQDAWTLSLVLGAARDKHEHVSSCAIMAAQRITKEQFVRKSASPDPVRDLAAARKRLLTWWEREGEAKYGRGDE